MLAAIRDGTDAQAAAPPDISFEAVAGEAFRCCARNWKPSTLKVNRNCYRNHILPWFKGHEIADITVRDVRRRFASMHHTPVSADRSAPILSVIVRQAEVYGYRPEGTNPSAGIRRYRRKGRERFLRRGSQDERAASIRVRRGWPAWTATAAPGGRPAEGLVRNLPGFARFLPTAALHHG